jgi:abortive infection bacteriophage resistance protein
MSKQTYQKAVLPFTSQLALLEGRGLCIENEAEALAALQQISYYRLSAYFLPYQAEKDRFNAGVTFGQVLNTYSFDRELRLLVFDCIERIEVAIRTQMIYTMALFYDDSHWQDNPDYFVVPHRGKIGNWIDPHGDFQAIINKAKTARTPEVFIKHYVEKYNKPANPPAWMCFELLTIGELSHIFRGLRYNADKKRIADFFDLHPTVFTSWLHTLTYVRNICAHHSRLWNKDLAIEPEILKKPVGEWISRPFENNHRVFYFLCMLEYMLRRANPTHHLKAKLDPLLAKYNTVPIQYLGIPSDGNGQMLDWKQEPLWR